MQIDETVDSNNMTMGLKKSMSRHSERLVLEAVCCLEVRLVSMADGSAPRGILQPYLVVWLCANQIPVCNLTTQSILLALCLTKWGKRRHHNNVLYMCCVAKGTVVNSAFHGSSCGPSLPS